MRSWPLFDSFLPVALLALLCACSTTPMPLLMPQETGPDPRLRSAGLMRALGEDRGPPLASEAEQALLRLHFDAVLAQLEAETPHSLAETLYRAEAGSMSWSRRERAELRRQLAEARAENIARLRAYRDAGRFPHHRAATDRALPIFVDAQDTACAVGFLMRESGWRAEVAEIAAADNHVFVDDADGGALLRWVATSGLTREEAALIQPAYGPPPPDAQLDELIASGDELVGSRLVYSNFAFEALLVEARGTSPAPSSLVDPSRFGVTEQNTNLFIGANQLDGVGGLARPDPPFGDDGSELRIIVSYSVEPLDANQGIDRISLFTFASTIGGGQFRSRGRSGPRVAGVRRRCVDRNLDRRRVSILPRLARPVGRLRRRCSSNDP